jgi:GNAT superfamily N-acetyltransferase
MSTPFPCVVFIPEDRGAAARLSSQAPIGRIGGGNTLRRTVTPRLDELVFRPATTRDAGRLAAVLVEGFETFSAFAPAEYVRPAIEDVADSLAARLETPAVWCELAEQGSHVAGYVSLLPAADALRPVADPRLAQFWMLFVRAPWWGTGLAHRLHGAACAAATTRGYTAMRLFTPAGQARARRFYEREGWTLAGGPYPDEDLRMPIVEYRRTLPASR